MEQLNTSKADMVAKLSSLADELFPVTYEVKTTEVEVEQEVSSEDEGSSSSSPQPQTETVSYLAATIHPLNQDADVYKRQGQGGTGPVGKAGCPGCLPERSGPLLRL